MANGLDEATKPKDSFLWFCQTGKTSGDTAEDPRRSQLKASKRKWELGKATVKNRQLVNAQATKTVKAMK